MNNPERGNLPSDRMTTAWGKMVDEEKIDLYHSMSETQMQKALSGNIEARSPIAKYLQALQNYLGGDLEF